MDDSKSTLPTTNANTSPLWRGVLLGTVVGVAFSVGGYLMLRDDQRHFGQVMFEAMPFIAGFAIALVVRGAKTLSACCITSGILSLLILIGTGLEGYICCLMAFPLMTVAMLIGALLGYVFRRAYFDRTKHQNVSRGLLLICLPALLAAADRAERPFQNAQRFETFATTVLIHADREVTWHALANMRSMEGKQPLLLWAGLPVPHSCKLDKAAVGSRRVCYFNQGFIAQEVTAWQPPDLMTIRVVENTLPGRRWLTFVDASYRLTSQKGGTALARTTTIASRLYPRWYWRFFEEWGVASEHRYVLANAKRWAEQK